MAPGVAHEEEVWPWVGGRLWIAGIGCTALGTAVLFRTVGVGNNHVRVFVAIVHSLSGTITQIPLSGLGPLHCWRSRIGRHQMPEQSASFAQSTENTTTREGLEWFVAVVKPQFELRVVERLEYRGFEPFCPTYKIRRQHERADRRTLHPPLFPGYVFCRFHRNSRAAVLKTPGVLSIVGFGRTAEVVGDAEIDRLQAIVARGLSVQPWPYLKAGDRIYISRGPLAGIEGLVLRTRGGWMMVVSVTLLQRSVAVSIGRDFIAPVWDADGPRGTSECFRKRVVSACLMPTPASIPHRTAAE